MILAIDQGTTGTTCLVIDADGRVRGRGYSEFTQHFPRPGWVEHDAEEIWEVSRAASRARRSPAPGPGWSAGAGSASPTSGRRWSSGTGRRASRCTARSSGRTAAPPTICRALKEAGHEPRVPRRGRGW
jgi:glycerol kinase